MGFAVGGANSVGVFLARTALSHSLVRGHRTGLSGCGVHIYPANIYADTTFFLCHAGREYKDRLRSLCKLKRSLYFRTERYLVCSTAGCMYVAVVSIVAIFCCDRLLPLRNDPTPIPSNFSPRVVQELEAIFFFFFLVLRRTGKSKGYAHYTSHVFCYLSYVIVTQLCSQSSAL